MEIAEALREAAIRLAAASDTPRLDAELLMAHAITSARSVLLLHHMADPVPGTFAGLVERRVNREPVAHIIGRQEFFGLEFTVSPAVLIPRPDSELVVEQALSCGGDARNILDCGTGSGALLLAVLHHMPAARGVGIDRSSQALEIARANAAALGLADRARLERADWDLPEWKETLGGPFDLILANPPYVETHARLDPTVRDFEPAGALFAGDEGLDSYRCLLPQLPGLLSADGFALIEIGATQADAVSAIARCAGMSAILHRDLGDRPRVLQLSHHR